MRLRTIVFIFSLTAAIPLRLTAQVAEHVDNGQLTRGGKQWSYSIRTLPPASFPDLPAAVRMELEKRQCMIPQTYQAKAPENVIQGEFYKKGSRDWAVLCSRNATSTLLVFSGDAAQGPAELATHKDAEMTQTQLATPTLGFAWGIDTVHPRRIRSLSAGKDSYDHDGVEDSLLSHGSSIHYWQDGAWKTLAGDE